MSPGDNFRVLVKFKTGDKRDETKFYLYLDFELFTKVKHVENHIATLFKLHNRLRLFINDVYLPRRENVQIIMPGDVLTVHPSQPPLECENCYKLRASRIAKEYKTQEPQQGIDLEPRSLEVSVEESLDQELFDELKAKYEELQNASRNKTEEDQNDDLAILEPEKKKRRRTRKRKVKETKETPEEMNISPQPISPVRPITPKGNGKHIRFGEENTNGIDKMKNTEEEQSEKQVSPGTIEKTEDDWKENLLNLVKSGKNKFFRLKEENATLPNGNSNHDKTEITNEKEINVPNELNGIEQNEKLIKNINIENCPIVDTFEPNDVIIFKKLKLDNNYCPIESNHILGQIIEVSKDTLTINVQEGSEELAPPQGKFSLEESTLENPKVDTIVELQISELLEIRLVKK